jgi:hypothetical protein
MYGGKLIAKGDMIFVFASENAGRVSLRAVSSPTPRQFRRSAASCVKRRA